MADYYVSATGDNTTGLSPATAWTLATLDTKLGDATVVSGDTIYFKGGEAFKGQLLNVDQVSNVSYLGGEEISFGTGKPILRNPNDDYFTSTWFSGLNAKVPLVYDAQSTLQTSTATNMLFESDENETQYNIVRHVQPEYCSISAANPAVVTWTNHPFNNSDDIWLYNRTGGVAGLDGSHVLTYIDANSFSLPVDNSTGGTTNALLHGPRQIDEPGMWSWFPGEQLFYRSSTDASPVVGVGHHLGRCNQANTLSLAVSAGTLSGLLFKNLSFDGTMGPLYFAISGTGSLHNITIDNCEFHQCAEPYISYTSTGTVSGITMKNCTTNYGRMIVFHTNNSTTRIFDKITLENNIVYEYNYQKVFSTVSELKGGTTDPECIYFQSVNHTLVKNCKIYGLTGTSKNGGSNPTGVVYWHGTTASCSNNVITGCYFTGFNNGQYGITLGTGLTDVCRNNYIVGNKIIVGPGEYLETGINYSDAATVNDNYILNNVLIGCNESIAIDAAGEKGITVYNNISLNPISYHIVCVNTTLADNTFDTNYYYPITGTPFLDGAIPQDFNTWSAVRSDNSIVTEQVLGPNYEATSGSDLDAAGTFVNYSLRDFNGFKYKLTPPIGAYEINTSRGLAKFGRDWR